MAMTMVKQWLARLRNRPIQIYVVVVSLYTLLQLLIQGPNIPNIEQILARSVLTYPYGGRCTSLPLLQLGFSSAGFIKLGALIFSCALC